MDPSNTTVTLLWPADLPAPSELPHAAAGLADLAAGDAAAFLDAAVEFVRRVDAVAGRSVEFDEASGKVQFCDEQCSGGLDGFAELLRTARALGVPYHGSHTACPGSHPSEMAWWAPGMRDERRLGDVNGEPALTAREIVRVVDVAEQLEEHPLHYITQYLTVPDLSVFPRPVVLSGLASPNGENTAPSDAGTPTAAGRG